MSMTRKHYEQIAQAIRLSRHTLPAETSRADRILLPGELAMRDAVRYDIASLLANRLAEDNPRFDRARFLAACEVTS